MKQLGDLIREQRLRKGLLLREAASELKVDPSLLSRIERNDKRVTREQVVRLAKILEADITEWMIAFLSDRVVYELRDEKLALQAMQLAERKISYAQKKSKLWRNRR